MILAALLATSLAAAPAGPALTAFEKWLSRYEAGRIDLYAQVPDGMPAAGRMQYFRSEAQDELRGLLDAVVAEGGEDAARKLLGASMYRADRDPAIERRKFVLRQPWLLRRLSAEALGRLADPEAAEWLMRIGLTDRDPLTGAARRAAALSALGRLRPSGAAAAVARLTKDESAEVRRAAALALGVLADSAGVAELKRCLADPDPGVRLAALAALDRCAGDDPELGDQVVIGAQAQLADAAWPVRMAAAENLRTRPDSSSVPMLIAALRREAVGQPGARRRVRSALRDALVALTGADYPSVRPEAWEEWWESARADFTGTDTASHPVTPEQGARFAGVPIESDVVMFLIDSSGSMGQPSTNDPDGPSRIAVAAREVKRCLDLLEAGTRFNVVLFGEKLLPFRAAPVPADAANRADAAAFLAGVEPEGGTDLAGALEFALGPEESALAGGELDTVVLVTDGVPSRGAVLDPDQIVAETAERNAATRIALHAIAVSGRSEFLERLAAANFGAGGRLGGL